MPLHSGILVVAVASVRVALQLDVHSLLRRRRRLHDRRCVLNWEGARRPIREVRSRDGITKSTRWSIGRAQSTYLRWVLPLLAIPCDPLRCDPTLMSGARIRLRIGARDELSVLPSDPAPTIRLPVCAPTGPRARRSHPSQSMALPSEPQ